MKTKSSTDAPTEMVSITHFCTWAADPVHKRSELTATLLMFEHSDEAFSNTMDALYQKDVYHASLGTRVTAFL